MDAPWLEDAVGWVAGTLTTVAFVPQVLKTWRTRSTRDISLTMWVAFSVGVALWIVYAVIAASWPIAVANAITLALSATVLALKLANRGRE
jgi:MtN3 and saliva related transmembrane protein